MAQCADCLETKCICEEVTKFFLTDFPYVNNQQYQLERVKKSVSKQRCLACWFFNCRCAQGLANK